jgi:S-adenosylmethionine-diacylglycerol 3-amino-3-carboxypropyl transferase
MKIANQVFQKIHQNNLIYNTCWEDPRCDRALLKIQPDSQVVMITSAGCNALDYTLDSPKAIHCVDVNPRQNALLNLKIASFQTGSYSDHYNLFAKGAHQQCYNFYRDGLRAHLPDYTQKYWDRNINFFIGKGIRKSFYHHGTAGLFAWSFSKYLKYQNKTHKLATRLFEAQNLSEQQDLYFELERKIFNNFTKWMVSRHLVMCMLGVPKSQFELFSGEKEGGGFIQKSMRHVFTELPLNDNYFWQLYFRGQYPADCLPNYLKPENFDPLRATAPSVVKTHTNTLSNFLKENPAKYSHYVLLDHQDWLAANDRPALEEEWRFLLQNSHSGTRILMRSAAYTVDFFPEFVKQAVAFETEETTRLHQQDRVGTYGSVYLGIVK